LPPSTLAHPASAGLDGDRASRYRGAVMGSTSCATKLLAFAISSFFGGHLGRAMSLQLRFVEFRVSR